MKRKFNNTVTKRLISAFLVLAMTITCIPVTDAEAKKKYQYKHDFYTVDGRKTDGHKEEIINVYKAECCPGSPNCRCGKYGLSEIDTRTVSPDSSYYGKKDLYAYGMNADEVKQLVAGKTVSIHVDRFRVMTIFSNTNVKFNNLFLEMSYTDKKGKKKEVKDFVWYDEYNFDYGDLFDINSAGRRDYKNDRVITDVDITLRLPSKAVYKKYTRFELPKGEKGKKKLTYKMFWFDSSSKIPKSYYNSLVKKDKKFKNRPDLVSEQWCKDNYTYVSLEGIEEPCEFYLGNGKWGDNPTLLGGSPENGRNISISRDDKTLKNGETVIIRGIYTHRKVSCRLVYTRKGIGKCLYDKFKHESQLGIKDAK